MLKARYNEESGNIAKQLADLQLAMGSTAAQAIKDKSARFTLPACVFVFGQPNSPHQCFKKYRAKPPTCNQGPVCLLSALWPIYSVAVRLKFGDQAGLPRGRT